MTEHAMAVCRPLDASDLRTVSMALGDDPTTGYNPPVAASAGPVTNA